MRARLIDDEWANEGASIDWTPWAHPFLTAENIARFRAYSDAVHARALEAQRSARPLAAAFAVNMAQNMYKWAKIAKRFGSSPTLYLNPQDSSALSRPEWEEFDGEFADIFDGPRFLREHPGIPLETRVVDPPNAGAELLEAYASERTLAPWQLSVQRVLRILAPRAAERLFRPTAVSALYARAPTVRHRALLAIEGTYPYFAWAEMLSRHDVTCIASTPFPAFASGKPYCICPVGGDLQFDCGRTDAWGFAMRLSFSSARFLLVSNPHTLGHCRRLGFDNAAYLPYPVDTDTYAPTEGRARRDWIDRFGGEVFILSTARVDGSVKGQTLDVQDALFRVAERYSHVRFMFLAWGADADLFVRRIAERGLTGRIVVLPPVGKRRLIDYYRSADIVLDQFVYGYFGATALEAAAIGKPVVMRLRSEQYLPLYDGDVAPIEQAADPEQISGALVRLIEDAAYRCERGMRLRDWVLRHHGHERTGPLLVGMLHLAATGARVNAQSPLRDPLSDEEIRYHARCRQPS